MTGAVQLVFVFAGVLALTSAGAEQVPPSSHAPVCTDASHARLMVQPGRDVCGPTLLPTGPVSVGFLPTVCRVPFAFLTVDAIKQADLCFEKPPVPSKR